MTATDAAAPQPGKKVVDIAPTRGWRFIDLREVWEYRELLFILVWRDVRVRYKQTFLGVLWVAAQPLLTMLFFTLLFSRVAKISPDADVPYSLFVMGALVPWTFFANSVSASGNSLIGSSHLISKVYFPRLIVPGAAVLAAGVDMAVTFSLVVLMMIAYGVPVTIQFILIPIPLVLAFFLALGSGLWLSSLNVEYRDVRVLVPFLLQLWLYATPVVYPLSVLPEWARRIATLNPMTAIVQTFRSAVFGGAVPWAALALSAAVTAAVLVSGAFYFRRSERRFADVL